MFLWLVSPSSWPWLSSPSSPVCSGPSTSSTVSSQLEKDPMSLTQADHGIAGLIIGPDGNAERASIPRREADGVTSFDEVIQLPGNLDVSLRARIFLPQVREKENSENKLELLPIFLYFHGGGFVLYHPDTFFYHDWCQRLATHVGAILVSVDYRLAPEHKLPAAFEDGAAALRWLKQQMPPMVIAGRGDFSRCFLMGDSAGGNIVHQVLLQSPAHVKGVVLLQPYFGGEQWTEMELRLKDDKYIPLVANDTLWRLALPGNWDRDCDACNPVLNEQGLKEKLKRCGGVNMLVVVGRRDPLLQRQRQYAEAIKSAGGDVKLVEYECSHGFMLFNSSNAARRAQLLALQDLKDFIVSCSSRTSKL